MTIVQSNGYGITFYKNFSIEYFKEINPSTGKQYKNMKDLV